MPESVGIVRHLPSAASDCRKFGITSSRRFIIIYHVTTGTLMHDVRPDSDKPAIYECLACGEQVAAETNPVDCPSCNTTGAFQQLGNSLE